MNPAKKLIRTLCIWYVYFPHVTMLRLIGPRCAVLVTRPLCYIHWLLTFVGLSAGIRRALARVLPKIRPDLPLTTALRKHLVTKHQYFVEHHLYPTARGRRFTARTYREIEGQEHLDHALAEGRGVILLGFHFGMSRMVHPALRELGYDNYHHKIEDATHARGAFEVVAHAVMAKQKRDEEAAGLNVIHHHPGNTFPVIAECLRRNAIVGIAGDGAAGAHFVDVPFLGGRISFPTGPARLAASTGAPIIRAFCFLRGLWRHRLVLHPPIYCRDESPASCEAVTRECAALLEEYIRRYPWEWWTWRRLDIEQAVDGQVRFVVRSPPAARGAPQAATSPTECQAH